MNIFDYLLQVSILLTLPIVILMGVMAGLVVILRDWRLALFAYAFESILLAILLMQRLPIEWALLQMIAGALVAAMLFLSARQLRQAVRPELSREARWPHLSSLGLFRLLAVLLALLAFVGLHTHVLLPVVSATWRDGILWLAIAGGLGLALHEEPLHAGLALLTLVGGVMLLLFSLTPSRTLVGLFGGWQLLLGLAVSYLVVSHGLAEMSAPSELSPLRWRL